METSEFDGDQCIVLPDDFMKSPVAAAELHEDELAAVASNFEVDNLGHAPGFFSGTLFVVFLWTAPSVWMVCL